MLNAASKIRGAAALRGDGAHARIGCTALTAAATLHRALMHSHAAALLQQESNEQPQTQRAPRRPWNYGRDWQTKQPRAPSQQQQQQDRSNDGADGQAPPELADERIVLAAQGKWFELEFVYGGPTRPFAIIHKPSGLSVQGRYGVDSVEKRLRLGYGVREVYFPHRLDKHTQGLMVVSFSKASSRALGASLEAGLWEKKYRTIVVVPPAVDMEDMIAAPAATTPTAAEADAASSVSSSATSTAAAATTTRGAPLITFSSKFPSSSYPASSLLSTYLQGSLWGASALPSAPAPLDSTDLVGSRTPVRIHLRPSATLRSYMIRRGLPKGYSKIDEAFEWAKWCKALVAAPANRQPQTDSDRLASEVGAFTASSPSKDGLAYASSPNLDRRRLHPFVPETMLYESVAFKPQAAAAAEADAEGGEQYSNHRKRADARKNRGSDEHEEDIDEAELIASEQAGSKSSSSQDMPKKSVTEFTLVASNSARRLALYDLVLVTGRSHQIRVHCSDAGCPVLNDPYYNAYNIFQWMRRAVVLKKEDDLLEALRKQGLKQPATTLELSEAVEAQAVSAATTEFPEPKLAPLVPPALPVRKGPAPLKHKSGTRISLERGVMRPSSRANVDAANNNKLGREHYKAASASGGSGGKDHRKPNKYASRAPRHQYGRGGGGQQGGRSFFTRSSSGLLTFRGPLATATRSMLLFADAKFTSSFADGRPSESNTNSNANNTSSSSSSKPRWTPDNFKRSSSRNSSPRSGGRDQSFDGEEEEGRLPQGRSRVGQSAPGGGSGGRRQFVDEHQEFDDPSERRVVRPRGDKTPFNASGNAESNEQPSSSYNNNQSSSSSSSSSQRPPRSSYDSRPQQQQQNHRRPSSSSSSSYSNSNDRRDSSSRPRGDSPLSPRERRAAAAESQSSSGGYTNSKGPRVPAWKRAEQAEQAQRDESIQFEHHVTYQGRRKPFKVKNRDDDEEGEDAQGQQQGQGQQSIRYTNRHDAPKRLHWLPEHVPYRLVAPNPQVGQAWGTVLAKYGVNKGAQRESLDEADRNTQPFTAATRYQGVERGAGAVGWLVKAPTSSSASTSESVAAALSTPTPSASSSASASSSTAAAAAASSSALLGDNHWFSGQVALPENEMALQAYFLRLPHPHKPDEIITCVQPLPKHWEKIMAVHSEERAAKRNAQTKTEAAPSAAETKAEEETDL